MKGLGDSEGNIVLEGWCTWTGHVPLQSSPSIFFLLDISFYSYMACEGGQLNAHSNSFGMMYE